MPKIVAVNFIDPAKREDFLALVKPLVEATRTEPDCISYSLFEAVGEPNCFTFIEEWKDMEAITFHNNTPHFTSIVPQIKQYCIEDGSVRIYDEVSF